MDKKKFTQLMASVALTLGVQSFKKEDGTFSLSDSQYEQIVSMFGQSFADEFKKNLGKHVEDSSTASEEKKFLDLQQQFEAYKKKTAEQISAAAEREKNLQNLVKRLSDEPERDSEAAKQSAVPTRKTFKADMTLLHNRVIENTLNGDGLMQLAGETINSSELQSEFGKYISDQKYEIISTLFGKVASTQYMTTKMTEKSEWRAVQSIITNLMQKFTPYWTPSGKVEFRPLTIVNRKHKINLAIKPAEIMEDVIAYLYDEGLQPKDMPIVKYIIEHLVKPKLDEERDIMLATDVYDEEKNSEKKDGDSGDIGGSMDGYVTILRKLYAEAESGMVKLMEGVTLTRENIYNEFDKIYTSIPVKYRTKNFNIHIDPDLFRLYELAREDKFPNSKNEDENKKRLQHTNFVFVPMDGMTGTGAFFITPKENFIHLLSKNRGASKIWMQGENYDVKLFGEWWESTGFAIAELIFGYAPAADAAAASVEDDENGDETV